MKTLLFTLALLTGATLNSTASPLPDVSYVKVLSHSGPKTVAVEGINISNATFTFEDFFVQNGQLMARGILHGEKTNFGYGTFALTAGTYDLQANCNGLSLIFKPNTIDITLEDGTQQSIWFVNNFVFQVSDNPEYKNLVGNMLCNIGKHLDKKKTNLQPIAAHLSNILRALPD